MPADDRKPKSVPALQVFRIMWAMFVCSVSAMMVATYTLLKPHPRPSPGPAISYALAGVAVVQMIFFASFRRRFLERSGTLSQRGEADAARQTWASAQFLGFASAEAIVLFGFVLHTMGAQPAWMSTVLFITGFMVFIRFFPQAAESR